MASFSLNGDSSVGTVITFMFVSSRDAMFFTKNRLANTIPTPTAVMRSTKTVVSRTMSMINRSVRAA